MLDKMSPHEAVTEYLEDRKTDLSDTSHENHRYRCQRFLEWADEYGLESMDQITGRKLHDFKTWRAEDVAVITLKNQLGTVRQFIAFCERIDVAPQGVHDRLILPEVGIDDEVCTDKLSSEEAKAILDYCQRFEYATLRHALFYLLWHTGIRISTLRAFDLEDYHGEYVEAVHREETPLKNKTRSQREINLIGDVTEVLDDFIEMHHPMVEDDEGRMPLFGTRKGRVYKTTVQRNIYTLTRPCHYTNRCPHSREHEECEATSYNTASKCPSSESPHAVRRGAITAHRNANVPKDIASDRMDVTGAVLDKHYDQASQAERRRRRKEFLEDI